MTRTSFARTCLANVTCLLSLASGLAHAQSADSTARFGIADIHASPHSSSPQSQFMRVGFYRGGRYEIRSASMLDRFDVAATAPAGATPEAAT